ncbi:hypothetical protein GW819_02170 [Candidatus Gracilibacteria bacterium]|nr:hypothetical protein [bacterium]NDK19624.1 hypothetical protein [Candidatus Gracilibacteria bacterium]OIO76635.1 MAG: hypothetical protein AUJ87_02350 [Candidatus Gracilibacteria bacterium CG1_02_38_174]PIQ11314.1 MAG: hypothetical protein COW68_02950 [Candidatus Gracilibacteria bacterium CG18_big_fil_WC_8_21_14_2_50_38_16]PIQ41132.1 MAG: hypothetical protein COW06_03950 [Candidatus Gracilibacteria bacterium CG12_big_fil_rev_8_21_14_0_65_38_15]PIZ02049.1 MAG: hypothetical protein COY60_0040
MFPKNKKIGIDLDETIARSFEPMICHINQKYGSALEFEHIIHHDWWTIPGFPIDSAAIVKEWEILLASDPSESKFLPVSGSRESLLSLKEAGYELHVITARNELERKIGTNMWIEENFPGIFSGVHFSSHYSDDRRSKSEICKMLDIGMMVDDNLDFALEMAEEGIEVYMLERPWNQARTEQHEKVKRAADWQEIIKDIQKTYV